MGVPPAPLPPSCAELPPRPLRPDGGADQSKKLELMRRGSRSNRIDFREATTGKLHAGADHLVQIGGVPLAS